MRNPSIKEEDFIIRPMRPEDIRSAIKLSNAEGWNQTEKDWKLFIENPGNVCLCAEWDKNVIGTTTAINYSNKIAWIAMVLVDKEYRGRGVSKSLLTNILQQLQSCTSIKLDATSAGKEVYKKFDFSDEYDIARLTNVAVKNVISEGFSEGSVNHILSTDIPNVISYDENVFGANRSVLLEYMIKEYPSKAWLLKDNETITGFALGRNGNKYHHIGPVLASNARDARLLITKALNELVHQRVVVDVLCDKADLLEWLLSIEFVKQRQFTRMYKKHNPFPGHIDKQFLICGPEFG